MEIKTILYAFLKYTYRAIEVLLLLSIAACIIYIGLNSHDSAEMVDLLTAVFVILIWLTRWWWFITLSIIIIVVASFIRCLIPPMSLYKKVVLALHILNVVLLFLFYIFLPKPVPCDAATMEKHYKEHQADMYDLVNYVNSALDDSCSIKLEYKFDEVRVFNIENKREYKTCKDIENQQELETALNTVGLSMQELNMIKEKMHKSGIIGIDISNNPCWNEGRSVLQFRWSGGNLYQYYLYDHPITEEDKHNLFYPYILYNDSVVFEVQDDLSGRGFPDKDKYNSQHNTSIN